VPAIKPALRMAVKSGVFSEYIAIALSGYCGLLVPEDACHLTY